MLVSYSPCTSLLCDFLIVQAQLACCLLVGPVTHRDAGEHEDLTKWNSLRALSVHYRQKLSLGMHTQCIDATQLLSKLKYHAK